MCLLLKSELMYSNPYKNVGKVKRCTILIFHIITLDPVSGCASLKFGQHLVSYQIRKRNP